MTEKFTNNAATTLNGTINNAVTSLTVASTTTFPTSGNFRIVIDNEIMLVTAVSGLVFTVIRGVEGTIAVSHSNGVPITHVLTSGALTQLIADSQSVLITDVDGATITFDLSISKLHSVILGGNRALALSNEPVTGTFTIRLVQDGTGTRTVTWWSGITWPSGTVPTLTTLPNKADVFTFLKVGSGAYHGFVAGLNL